MSSSLDDAAHWSWYSDAELQSLPPHPIDPSVYPSQLPPHPTLDLPTRRRSRPWMSARSRPGYRNPTVRPNRHQSHPQIHPHHLSSTHPQYAAHHAPASEPYWRMPVQQLQDPSFYSQYPQATAEQPHSRQLSTSTVTTNGPDSPVLPSASFPFIATPNQSPFATYHWTDEASAPSLSAYGADAFLQPEQQVYFPAHLSHSSAAHAALKDMAIDHHNSNSSEDVPDFMSSRRSDSTHGRNTPATPRANTSDDLEDKAHKMPVNEFQRGHVELYRTESAACQDELFNPANFDATPHSPPPTSNADQKDLLSPQGNLVNERVRTANSIRSQSPSLPIARERSPFRQGSKHAPPAATNNYSQSTGAVMPSAASIRQREKEQADLKELGVHRPTLKREVTKTMSPKDALLDAPDSDCENSLSAFTDVVPEGYQKHLGGSAQYPTNFVTGTSQAFNQFVPLNQTSTNMGGFRGLDLNNWLATPMPAPAANAACAPQPTATQTSDKNPEFPAHLASMESSMSESLPISSQESAASLAIKRPANTSANTGSYTCTYHGCTQRFESPANLQKHKREAHQSVAASSPVQASPVRASTTPEEDGESMSGSPEPLGSGMTSSALLARNSQAGPHKCNRMNPTTGKPCSAIFSRPYDLTRHEDTIHNRQKQKVRCEYCRDEKTFSRNDALTRHMRVVHPEIDFQGKRGRRVF